MGGGEISLVASEKPRAAPSATAPARLEWRWPLAFAGFALMVVAILSPGNVSLDGASMLQVGRSLQAGHGFKVACQYGAGVGRDGACYSFIYPLQSILAVPLITLGRGAAAVVGGPRTFVGDLFAQLLPALAAAGTAMFTVDFAQRLGATRRRALL